MHSSSISSRSLIACCNVTVSLTSLAKSLTTCLLAAEQVEHIRGQWEARIASTAVTALCKSLVKAHAVPKTAAYRTTFCHAGTLASMERVLHETEEEVASCLTAFVKEHVYADIVTSIGTMTQQD